MRPYTLFLPDMMSTIAAISLLNRLNLVNFSWKQIFLITLPSWMQCYISQDLHGGSIRWGIEECFSKGLGMYPLVNIGFVQRWDYDVRLRFMHFCSLALNGLLHHCESMLTLPAEHGCRLCRAGQPDWYVPPHPPAQILWLKWWKALTAASVHCGIYYVLHDGTNTAST